MTVEMLFFTSMRPKISDLVIPLRKTSRILARKMQTAQYMGLSCCPLAQRKALFHRKFLSTFH